MKMHSDSVCRLCLAVEADNKMLSLTPMQELYEKVTNNRLHINKMPVTVCYICYAQLKRCYKFMAKSTMAENTLIEILNTQTEITPKSVCTINRDAKGLTNPLTVTTVKHEHYSLIFNDPALVKTELIEQVEIDIKEEVVEDTTVSDAEDCGVSEEYNVPLQCIIDENPGVPNETEQFEDETTAMKPESCNFCDKRFMTATHFKQHLLTHSGEKPYKCDICNSKFTYKKNIIKHIKTHTDGALAGSLSNECDVCHRKFTQKRHLRAHLTLHTGEYPFKCKICNRGFGARNSCIRHERTHTGDKAFECEICNRSFNEKGNLLRHVRVTHTGEKPFECRICNRRFSQKSHLSSHVTTHTGEKPFECTICNRSFLKKSNLVRHERRHHTGEK